MMIHPLFVLTAVVAVIFTATDFFLALTFSVILHELAHAVMAKHFGAIVSRLTLTPFGGALNVQTKILTSQQKSLIYWAGPVASLFFSLFFGTIVWLFPTIFCYLEYLVVANFFVGVINLLPIYPLDGGKILAQSIPLKWILIWSNLFFLITLIMSLIMFNWWWTFFAVVLLIQINWAIKQSVYVDKFIYKSQQRTGKLVRYAVLSHTTLFEAYKMLEKKHPTEFIVSDCNNAVFYENDLEQWLLKFPSDKFIKDCI